MDKKLLIFLVVFFIFLWGYQKLILERFAPPPKPSERTEPGAGGSPQSQVAARSGVEPQSAVTGATTPAEAPAVPATATREERKVVVDTPLYRAVFSNEGAVLTSFQLKKFTNDAGQFLEMVPQAADMKEHPLELAFDEKEMETTANRVFYQVLQGGDLQLKEGQQGSIQFLYSDKKYVFRKELRFDGSQYMMTARFEALQGGRPVRTRVTWAPGLETAKGYRHADKLQPTRAVINTGEKVEHLEPKKANQFHKAAATIRWAGVETNYFMAVAIPEGQIADAYIGPAVSGEDKKFHSLMLEVAGQDEGALNFRLFVGPKDYDLLKKLGMDLEDAVDFGFFGPIAKILLVSLKVFYRYVHNYGLAILLLTVIVKIIFTPFMQKSFESQRKMQQMQPELKKIQEKYSKMKNDDPRKTGMNTEVMQLHKRYGVNPLGGCLPMLVQMPVLYAFWRLLSNAIELRKAPFYWWIQDLASPDPYYVLPVLMGGSMLLQQRMTPISDPSQRMMMYMMPVMFTFFSFKFQSGLVIYWLFSNVLAIAHQYYFQQRQRPQSPPAAVAVVKEPNA